MREGWKIALTAIAIPLLSGILFLFSRPPRGHPIDLLPAPTSLPLIVEVAGAVYHPGVYSLPVGSRVQAALEAAGGATTQADLRGINQAAPLLDGVQIFVPKQGEAASGSLPPSTSTDSTSPSTAASVPINSADQEQLESLPGIGPVTAQKIIAYRLEHGPFQSVEGLLEVPGIGPATLKKIQGLITLQ